MNDFHAQAIEHGIDIAHHFSSGVYAKETHIPAGKVLTQHVHSFDHLSVLASGSAMVEVDGVGELMTGPTVVTIKAHKEHKVTSLTDVVWFCIHATDETDPEKVDARLTE